METFVSFLSPSLVPVSPLRSRSLLSPLLHRPTSRFPPLRSTPSQSATLPAAITQEEEKFNWYSHWYPVAPVCDLDKRKPHAKRVLGLDVVVWWDQEQRGWRVFDDRCPHRLAPLSEGRIDQWGRLQCVYHGWCFNGAGSCKLIPQAPPDGPPVHTYTKACAAVYPSIEQNRIVWFWPSTDPMYRDIATRKKPHYIPQLDDPSFTSSMGTRDLCYGYDILAENLMDPAHVPYAHYKIIRASKNKAPRYVYQFNISHLSMRFLMLESFLGRFYREGGRPMEITIEKLDETGFLSRQELGYGKFVAPCLYYAVATLGTGSRSVSSQNMKEDSSAKTSEKQRSFLLVFYCIPVSPGRSRVIFATPRNFSVWLDQIVPRWVFHIGQNLVLDSDLYLLHLEEYKIAEIGRSAWPKACYVPTKSDAMVVAFRRWFAKYTKNEIDWGTKFSGHLPPSPPKEQILDRYWTHTMQCSSCLSALQGLKALEVFLQVFSVFSIGILAATKQNMISTVTRISMVVVAVLCFIASKWLSHFIYKNFYFHDYNHAFR